MVCFGISIVDKFELLSNVFSSVGFIDVYYLKKRVKAATLKDLPPASPAAKPQFGRCYHQVQTNKQN